MTLLVRSRSEDDIGRNRGRLEHSFTIAQCTARHKKVLLGENDSTISVQQFVSRTTVANDDRRIKMTSHLQALFCPTMIGSFRFPFLSPAACASGNAQRADYATECSALGVEILSEKPSLGSQQSVPTAQVS